jgi:hypothetical protein
MYEYLVRQIDDEEFFILFQNWKEVLRPSSFETKIVQESGKFHIEVEGCKISFSPEPPGMQVSFCEFSISEEKANQIVQEILANMELHTGRKGRIIPI